jgi:hypothetical protein
MPTIDGYASGEPVEAVDINQYFLRGNRNALINGDFRVAQRGTTLTVADGAYGLDRWVALGSGTGGVGSSGQNVNMIQISSTGDDVVNRMLLTSSTAGLKFGCVQIIESSNLGGLKSGTVTVSFKAAVTNGAADVRCAVLGWSGTADAVTRDVVSTSGTPWLSSPPTLAANWSYLNTPVDLNVTNTVATYRVNANVTGLPNNLAVFIWVNGTSHASNGAMQLSDVQLESGAIATPFERKTFQEQLADCQRYYWRVISDAAGYRKINSVGTVFSSSGWTGEIYNPVPLRVIATSIEAASIRTTDRVSWNSTLFTTATLNTALSTVYQTTVGFTGAGGIASNPSGVPVILSDSTASIFAVSAEL